MQFCQIVFFFTHTHTHTEFYCQGGWETGLPESYFYGRGGSSPYGGGAGNDPSRSSYYYGSNGGGDGGDDFYEDSGGGGGGGGGGGSGGGGAQDEELEYLLSGEESNVTLGFLVARPVNTSLVNSPRRVCFTYLRDSNGTRFSWVVDTVECKRHVARRPPGSVLGAPVTGIRFRFSSVKEGECSLYVQ